jgi:hypothetical protein
MLLINCVILRLYIQFTLLKLELENRNRSRVEWRSEVKNFFDYKIMDDTVQEIGSGSELRPPTPSPGTEWTSENGTGNPHCIPGTNGSESGQFGHVHLEKDVSFIVSVA